MVALDPRQAAARAPASRQVRSLSLRTALTANRIYRTPNVGGSEPGPRMSCHRRRRVGLWQSVGTDSQTTQSHCRRTLKLSAHVLVGPVQQTDDICRSIVRSLRDLRKETGLDERRARHPDDRFEGVGSGIIFRASGGSLCALSMGSNADVRRNTCPRIRVVPGASGRRHEFGCRRLPRKARWTPEERRTVRTSR